MRSTRWILVAVLCGVAVSVGACLANAVPGLLGEVGTPRAERSGLAQVAEFVSLVLDSGWGWAALAVLVGWIASVDRRWPPGALVGAGAGCVALLAATAVYYWVEPMFTGDPGWGSIQWFWLVAGVVFGPPLGAVGATIRRPGLIGVLASLVAPAVASLNLLVIRPPHSAAGTLLMWVVWAASLAFAAAVAVRAVRSHRDNEPASAPTAAT